MGDRVSIAFSDGRAESVALFNHWAGRDLPDVAQAYAQVLIADIVAQPNMATYPLGRLEPNTVMVDFIRDLAVRGALDTGIAPRLARTLATWYLGKDGSDGDNSDNGHHVIHLDQILAAQRAKGDTVGST